jgi:hypothetical protein
MSEYLIIFIEGEGVVKEPFIKFHRFDDDLEDERSVILHVGVQGFDAIEGHRNVLDMENSTLYNFYSSNLSSRYSPPTKQKR